MRGWINAVSIDCTYVSVEPTVARAMRGFISAASESIFGRVLLYGDIGPNEFWSFAPSAFFATEYYSRMLIHVGMVVIANFTEWSQKVNLYAELSIDAVKPH